MRELKPYYITFGLGSVFRHYYLELHAMDEAIARAWCAKFLPGIWSGIYTAPPDPVFGLEPLKTSPIELHYSAPEHV